MILNSAFCLLLLINVISGQGNNETNHIQLIKLIRIRLLGNDVSSYVIIFHFFHLKK